MQLIRRLLAVQSDLPEGSRVVISAERRQFLKRRWRGLAADGMEFGFDLDERLINGCVVHHLGGLDYVVRQLPETVYEVEFGSADRAALIAWKVGNLHLPAEILPDRIRVLHDEAMTQLLDREGWTASQPEVVFNPMKAMAHSA
jgi:urease accessory protein